MQRPARIGMIGCGNISSQYFEVAQQLPEIEIVACGDMMRAAAEAQAEKYGLDRVLEPDEILAADDVDMVLNLTPPGVHYTVAKAALEAGKSTYSEKPFALHYREGAELVALAQEKGLRIGCAPDTFLGGGFQSARRYLDEGIVGAPVAATAFMMSRGHEHWHPNPAFYYKPGGGPMFDMGPYYLTALVHLLGPVRRVTGSARATWPERMILSEPKQGEIIEVEVPTHVVGVLDFASGPVGTIITTFDVKASVLPRMELYGTTGTLSLPDPNTFDGPVRVRGVGDEDWQDLPLRYGHTGRSRGMGPADMAASAWEGVSHRANGELAVHVLEIMEAIHVASETGQHVELVSTCERPEPLPEGVYEGVRPA